MFGVKHTDAAKEKMRRAPKMRGEKHWSWQGGRLNYWRKLVLERDNYTCQDCGLHDKTKGFLEADHTKPRKKFPSLQFDINNGRTLCPNCHRRKSLTNKDLSK